MCRLAKTPERAPSTLSVVEVEAKGMIEAIVDETTARLARQTVVTLVVTSCYLLGAGRRWQRVVAGE